MEHRSLGSNGPRVSRLALGTARHGHAALEERQVERALNHALDQGIALLDTAPVYGCSEARIGRYLSGRGDQFAVATKCGSATVERTGHSQIVEDFAPESIRRSVDRSRQRLRRDCIDLVQFHGLPPTAQLDTAFEALLGIREKGWARCVGVSADGPAAAAFAGKPTGDLDAAALARRWPVDVWQFTYNFLSQEAAAELMPTLRLQGMGTLAKRPIANAVWDLPEEPGDDFFRKPWQRARKLRLAELAGGLSVVEFALRFTLSHPDVDAALLGSVDVEHVAQAVGWAARGPLPEAVLRPARSLFAGVQWRGMDA
jgi:aryl-alcohol dehydrogenase-like predicted oxidoreductase